MTGTASWISQGATIVDDVERGDTHETVSVRNPTTQPATLVFARMAWPGYSATAGGAQLEIDTYDDVLTSVTIPAGYEGDVELVYFPRSWRWALPISGVAILAGIALSVLGIRRSRSRAVREDEARA
jgi:uncharacterized membrane protein YfhO